MESLTKQQIVLLTLLVSFITSIATGIVTVALMDQAPKAVTQTVNRVVERTVEKIVPSQNQSAAVVTKETVVVKEDDLVVSAIEKNTKSLVSITKILGEGEFSTKEFVGNGLVVSKDGLVITDASIAAPDLDENQNPLIRTFKMTMSDGNEFTIKLVPNSYSNGMVAFRPELTEQYKRTVFSPASLADVSALKLGQAVIAMGGEKVSVATGIVSNISHYGPVKEDTATSTPNHDVSLVIKSDVSIPGKAEGGILLNLNGEVVGLRVLSAGSSDNLFLSSGLIPRGVK